MLTVVVGGFFGDEGKGKVVSYLSIADEVAVGVRCGSVNAGHTVVHGGRVWKLRVVPSAFVRKEAKLLIPPGALIRIDVLLKEMKETGVRGRLFLDPQTGVIEEKHVEAERASEHLKGKVGSTLQGVGAAASDRVLRKLRLARDFKELNDMLTDVPDEVHAALRSGMNVIVEGTQGTFLSLYHGTYPYVTSRDTTAAAFASEVGVGPRDVDEVVVVFKAYVTRVGGGPLPGELPEDEAVRRSWVERATVTGRVRRVAPFNVELARRAVMINSATQVAVTKVDALFPEASRVREWGKLPRKAREWIEGLENALRVPVTLIGTGPEVGAIIDRRKELGFLK